MAFVFLGPDIKEGRRYCVRFTTVLTQFNVTKQCDQAKTITRRLNIITVFLLYNTQKVYLCIPTYQHKRR